MRDVGEMMAEFQWKKDARLEIELTPDGELSIHIGINVLAVCADLMDANIKINEQGDDFEQLFRVTDPLEFARDVRRALLMGAENGSTPLNDLLDKACLGAFEDGSLGAEEASRVQPKAGAYGTERDAGAA